MIYANPVHIILFGIKLNMDWSGSHAWKMKRIIYTLYNLRKVAGTYGESWLYVLHFVYVDLYANGYIPTLYSLLGFSVSVIT